MAESVFPSTRRSILASIRNPDAAVRREALSAVVEAYWKPAYKYIRLKWKAPPDDAQDLTQAFFAALLERGLLARYDPARAAFRTYLRTCIDGLVANQRKSAARLKRGGAVRLLPLDFLQAEAEVARAPSPESAEDVFHREWQRQMFALAVQDLKQLCASSDKDVRFALFESYDLAPAERPSYADLSARFRIPVTTVTNHLAWARRELRRCLMDRLASITSGESELRAEAARLLTRS